MISPDNTNAQPTYGRPKLTQHEIQLRQLLKTSPQDLWLDTLRRTRGPEHRGLVYWMLSQTECDFAVATHAFYRCNPANHLDNPRPLPLRPQPSDLFALILLNWDTGSYRTHRLKVEAQDADPRAIARIRQKVMAHPQGSLPFKIPGQFLEPSGGSPIKLPPHLLPDEAPHLWSLYTELGLDVDAAAPGIARKVARAKSLFQRIRQSGLGA